MDKEALYYQKTDNTHVQCTLCPHMCKIGLSKWGFCGIRSNQKGKLVTVNYAQVSSLAVDLIEKKPLYEFFPGSQILSLGTIGCNMRCGHCQNWNISQEHDPSYTKKLPLKDLLYLISEEKHQFVAFTYNEPIIWYEYVLAAAKELQKMGTQVVMVSNGYINPEPLQELLPYTNAWSLDIKWAFDETAKKLSAVPLAKPVFETAKTLHKAGIHIEITTNIVAGYNDSNQELAAIAKFIAEELGPETPWHISRSFPAYKLQEIEITPKDILEKARDIGEKTGLTSIYFGNV